MLWYSLEVPHRGTSNEYHNMFSGRNKETIYLDTFLISSYEHMVQETVKPWDRSVYYDKTILNQRKEAFSKVLHKS